MTTPPLWRRSVVHPQAGGAPWCIPRRGERYADKQRNIMIHSLWFSAYASRTRTVTRTGLEVKQEHDAGKIGFVLLET